MVEISIREAKVSDIPGLYSTMLSTRYIQFRYGDATFEEVRDRLITELFEPEDIKLFVAIIPCAEGNDCVQGERVIGYTIMAPYAAHKKATLPLKVDFEGRTYDLTGYAYSWGTGVHEDYRGHRIGPALRLHADNEAKRLGFRGVVTNVDAGNTSSIRVQERAGFIKIADIPDKERESGIDTLWVKELG